MIDLSGKFFLSVGYAQEPYAGRVNTHALSEKGKCMHSLSAHMSLRHLRNAAGLHRNVGKVPVQSVLSSP